MSNILMIAIAGAGLGLIFFIFKLLKKVGKLAARFPTNFLVIFLIFALLGLSGFLSTDLIARQPVQVGVLILIVSFTSGIVMTDKLYGKWEWSIAAPLWKKILYLGGITLTGIVAFLLVFMFCEHRGLPKGKLGNDLAWCLGSLIFITLLPLAVKELHNFWNEIPRLAQIKPVFNLPLYAIPPFIESGGPSVNFFMIIPLDYDSHESIKPRLAVPKNKTLAETYHHLVHEHNIVKRHPKQIVLAENRQSSKAYGWSFFRPQRKWWGLITKRVYLNHDEKVGALISNGDTIFVERIKTWK